MSSRTLRTFLGIQNSGPLKAYIDLNDTKDGTSPEHWLTPVEARRLANRLMNAADKAERLADKESDKIKAHAKKRREEMRLEDEWEDKLFESGEYDLV